MKRVIFYFGELTCRAPSCGVRLTVPTIVPERSARTMLLWLVLFHVLALAAFTKPKDERFPEGKWERWELGLPPLEYYEEEEPLEYWELEP